MNKWYLISDVDLLDTPALVIYPDRVKANLDVLKTYAPAERIRPHVKTHKSMEAAKLCIGAGINKFKCATIAEAEMLGMCSAKDVLLAYQPVGPKVKRLMALIARYPDTAFSCLADNLPAARQIATQAGLNKITIDVYIDINVGMNRSGMAPEQAFALYGQLVKLPGIRIKGLHLYDGHIHDEEFDQRAERCHQAFAPVKYLISQLKQTGFDPVVIAGGSPTFPVHAQREGVECSPGTFIYWDWGYLQECREQDFLPAALVITRVISLPDATRVCVDLGHKSIASENVLDKRVRFLNAPDLRFFGHSEEHMVLDAGPGHRYKPGDVLYGLPYHICPTVALYERAITILNGEISGEWKTIARDRKINC